MLLLPLLLLLSADTVEQRFAPPAGFTRVVVAEGSFGASLRSLPLLPAGTPVKSYAGEVIDAPWAQAVVDLDVGTKDLQQCADSALRVYADYRFSAGTADALSFHATSGDPLPWRRYAAGERPVVVKNRIQWKKKAEASKTKETFHSWLFDVFMWAGSKSLALDTVAVDGLAPGDLLVVGGSPGHVLVVLDVAEKKEQEKTQQQLLLGQGFMPAQSFQVLGWFAPAADGAVSVPSWPAPFGKESRRRFKV